MVQAQRDGHAVESRSGQSNHHAIICKKVKDLLCGLCVSLCGLCV
jgi:hypothetical protein